MGDSFRLPFYTEISLLVVHACETNVLTIFTYIFHLKSTSNGSGSLAGTSHLNSHTAPPPTVVHPQMIGIGSLVGAVMGTFIGTTLLYAVILLIWNKNLKYFCACFDLWICTNVCFRYAFSYLPQKYEKC